MQTFDKVNLQYILFENAFTGCHITSSIFNFGKTSILSKIQQNTKLSELSDKFYIDDTESLEIGNTTMKLFEFLHSFTKISQSCSF